ncbi:replication endonuclease [Aliiglaciecola sp. 3_MG-2023]|uniref:replication endonuclease n=1 Tax=Aliiglaciecola sp. 3_MG-2023 TaxID=3062644 RepID=UPI0026E1FEE0|nr:replication endonuclease [Aliiglaciecola sp. 3_MG-2023]MDO6693569.1 replication endonuclease [Aliiglaciecola sp. 3_MG-2023]
MRGLKKATECPKSASKCLKSVTSPDELTQGIGTRECHEFRKKIFNRITPISYDTAHKYLKITRELDYVHANRFLNRIDKQIHIADLNITWDIKEIREFANKKSMECILDTVGLNDAQSVAWCKAKLLKYGITLPEKASDIENIASAKNEKFWFLKLKQLASQKFEQVRRSLDLINQSKSPYCSNDQLRQWEWEKEQSLEYMSKNWFCSASGELISMLDAYKSNVSNPAIRRAELMVRIKGTEEYSKLLGHIGYFYTITSPSKYHSHYKTGRPNPKYQNFNVKETNDYLCKQWQKTRAQFHRENIQVYGLRVVEPHHDGTPHWHLMLFMAPEHAHRVTEILKFYALEDDGAERGAEKNRFNAKEIIPEKGSAQDYIAKYVCKNIDGEYIDKDKYGNDAKTSAKRITAWASLFRIRQFQFIGGPSVSLWRELRKTKESKSSELEEIRKAADSSDWLTYLVLMGGHNIPKQDRPFAIEYKKQLKKHLEGLEASTLSEHAFNKKPCSIRSTTNNYPIEDKGWKLLSSPPEQINCSPAPRDGRAVDEASGGYRRAWGGAPPAGRSSNPVGLGLV